MEQVGESARDRAIERERTWIEIHKNGNQTRRKRATEGGSKSQKYKNETEKGQRKEDEEEKQEREGERSHILIGYCF